MATRVLITGASGLIGTHVVAACVDHDLEPIPLDHSSHDLLDPAVPEHVVSRARPDALLHLAWSASGTPGYRESADNERWTEASLALHEACLRLGVAFFGVGTGLDDREPGDAYTGSKVRLRQRLAEDIADGRLTWLRPYYVFDPDRGRPALVAEAQAAVREGRAATLFDPGAQHDFVHARDVGTAMATAIGERMTGVQDIGSGRCHQVTTLVERLGAPWAVSPRSSAAVHHDGETADIRRLAALGWAPHATEEFFDDA